MKELSTIIQHLQTDGFVVQMLLEVKVWMVLIDLVDTTFGWVDRYLSFGFE